MSKIKKSDFISLVKKYNLNSTIESAIIDIDNNAMTTNFILDDYSLKGRIVNKDFQYENSNFAITETSSLLKVLTVLDEDIEFSLKKSGDRCKILELNDEKVSLKIVLADPALVNSVDPNVNKPNTDFIKLTLTSDILSKISKCVASLNRCEKFSITADALEGKVNFSFKENSTIGSVYSNSIDDNTVAFSFIVPNMDIDINATEFFSNTFKNIIDANKEYDSCDATIYSVGLMSLEFSNTLTDANYYLVALSN